MWTAEQRQRHAQVGLRYPSDLTDAEWSLVEPMIPPARRGGRRRTVDVRAILDAIFYVLATGCQWRALPKDLPPKSTVHDYLTLWAWDGTLGRLHHALFVEVRERAGKARSRRSDRGPSAAIIDRQSVKSAEKGGRALIRAVTTRARVRLEGVHHLWRKVPSGELSIDPEADERRGWATGLVEAS